MINQNINCGCSTFQMFFAFFYQNISPQRRRGHRDSLRGLSALCDSAVSILNEFPFFNFIFYKLECFSIPFFNHESTKTRKNHFRALRVLRGKYKHGIENVTNVSKYDNNDTKNDTDVTKDVTNVTKISRLDKILDLIKSDNSISLKEISEQLNVSKKTILRDIDKLKKMGKLKFIGEKRTGHWEIIEND